MSTSCEIHFHKRTTRQDLLALWDKLESTFNLENAYLSFAKDSRFDK